MILDVMRFQILTDDQMKLVFEVKKDDQGRSFLPELNKAIEGKTNYCTNALTQFCNCLLTITRFDCAMSKNN